MESFIEVNKKGDMKDQIRIQIVNRNPIEMKKASKEIGRREGKTPFNEMLEKNKFVNIVVGHIIGLGGSPLDYLLRLKETLPNKPKENGIVTLTLGPFLLGW